MLFTLVLIANSKVLRHVFFFNLLPGFVPHLLLMSWHFSWCVRTQCPENVRPDRYSTDFTTVRLRFIPPLLQAVSCPSFEVQCLGFETAKMTTAATFSMARDQIVLIDARSTTLTISWPPIQDVAFYLLEYRTNIDNEWEMLADE